MPSAISNEYAAGRALSAGMSVYQQWRNPNTASAYTDFYFKITGTFTGGGTAYDYPGYENVDAFSVTITSNTGYVKTFNLGARRMLVNENIYSDIVTIPHNTDTGEVTITIEFTAGYTGSRTFSPPAITYYAGLPQCAQTMFIDNDTPYEILIRDWITGCSYDVYYNYEGSINLAIASRTTAQTVEFTPSTNLYAQIPNTDQLEAKIWVKTYMPDGTELAGGLRSQDVLFRVDYNKGHPIIDRYEFGLGTIASYEHTPADHSARYNKTVELTGVTNKYILNYTYATAAVYAESRLQSTMSSLVVKNGSQSIQGESNSSTDRSFRAADYFIEPIKEDYFTVEARDSRGLEYVENFPVDTVPYVPLTCSASISKPTTEGVVTLSISGKYWSGNFGAVENALELVWYMYDTADGTTPISSTIVTPEFNTENNSYSISIDINDLDYTKVYYVCASAKDALITIEETPRLKIVVHPIFDWGEDSFNFNVPINVEGAATVAGNTTMKGNAHVWGNLHVTGDFSITGYDFPVVSTWTPKLAATSNVPDAAYGYAIRIGDMCIINFFLQQVVGTTNSKMGIEGLPFTPDGTRWWAGGGNCANYLLYNADTSFSGWCIESNGSAASPAYYIYGRACEGRNASQSDNLITKTSKYIGAKAGDTFIASGTIMYKVAAGQ